MLIGGTFDRNAASRRAKRWAWHSSKRFETLRSCVRSERISKPESWFSKSSVVSLQSKARCSGLRLVLDVDSKNMSRARRSSRMAAVRFHRQASSFKELKNVDERSVFHIFRVSTSSLLRGSVSVQQP